MKSVVILFGLILLAYSTFALNDTNPIESNSIHHSIHNGCEDGGIQCGEIHTNDSVIIIKGNHKIAHVYKQSDIDQQHLLEQQTPTPSSAFTGSASSSSTFSTVSVDIPWGLPVEVQLVGSLPSGTGSLMYDLVTKSQSSHPEYILAFNEGSAKIMNTNFKLEDPTAVYTFSVDKEDLVFHRHEGHRCITGMTGSGGALMKFSTVTHTEAKQDPQSFIDNMFIVDVPADSIFVLRFNGMVYHQFGPRDPNIPAFWAVSVHTNEKGGELSEDLLQKVLNGEGNIPLLTEPIPDAVDELLKSKEVVDRVTKYYLRKAGEEAITY